MFHVVFSLASRFLYLGNMLQGFAHRILALRSLDAISSILIPALPPPPPVPLLDAPVPFVELLEEIILPLPSVAIERQPPAFSSLIPSYQSSLIAVSPSQFSKFLPFFVVLAAISGFVIILPTIIYFFAKIPSAFANALPSRFTSSKLPISLLSLLLLWTGPPAIASFLTFIWFISILFSYEQCSSAIVTTLQWCGLLTVQDTGTPPLLDAIYEQTARGAAGRSDLVDCSDLSYEHGKGQAITGSLGYAHLVIQLSEHKRELQHARTWRETQEREAQRTYAKFVDSQNNLHRQLEFSRVREQNLHADLFAAEKEHEKLKALISSLEASNREQQGWEEVAATAKTRCAEAEVTASKLRVDLAAAVDRVCNVQDQLVRQMELASDKDKLIQTITEESRRAHTKLRCAEDKIKRLDARLLDRRVPERKPLDGQVVIRDRHERRQSQDVLRDPPPLDRNLQPRYRRPTTTLPDDTGQTPLPPEQIRYTGTLPVSSAIN
ncbi:hypothetical protein BJV77DRAFT_1068869 [Russula vinacea]|nr:hypothetical protein BJV77DRAFT_1068869 [Russula vinacea]